MVELNPEEVNYVIYHNPCCDGTASAFAAYIYFMENNPDQEVKYKPTQHGSKPPDVTGKNVLICDFSYRKEILEKMIKQANKLLVIDHHLSAQKGLADIDDKYKIFDMEHSGAVLTWNYFFPDKEPPLLFKYVEDRDLWKKELPNTDAFASYFFTLEHSFEAYLPFLDNTFLLTTIKNKGMAYMELNEHYTRMVSYYACPKFCRIAGKYYFVSYINSNVLKSDIGNYIFKLYPNTSFSAVYSMNDWEDTTSFSLRSTKRHADVSEVATFLGGGGHRNASGLRLDYVGSVLPGKIYDSGKSYQILNNIYFSQIRIDHLNFYIVYLNSVYHKRALGHYLLQDLYKDEDGVYVQNCVEIHNCQGKEFAIDRVDIAAVWSFNGNNTEFTIIYNSKLDSERVELLESHLVGSGSVYTVEGLAKKIEL